MDPLLKRSVAEFIGTALLVFFGAGAAVITLMIVNVWIEGQGLQTTAGIGYLGGFQERISTQQSQSLCGRLRSSRQRIRVIMSSLSFWVLSLPVCSLVPWSGRMPGSLVAWVQRRRAFPLVCGALWSQK